MQGGRIAIKCVVLTVALVNVCAMASRRQENSAGDLNGLDVIKNFAGDWVTVDAEGKLSHDATVSFAVTAGGNAVVETLYPGTARETVTVYHGDGDELLLTHYSTDGSNPRLHGLRVDSEQGAKKLQFRCIRGTNATSEYRRHLHRASITVLDADHIRAEWHTFERGQSREIETLDLVRVSK